MGNDKTDLRRYKDDLHISGLAVIILGAWSVLKVIMEILIDYQSALGLDELTTDDRLTTMIAFAIVVAIMVIISLLIFWFHYYIGINASRAARGLPYKKGYYAGAVFMFILSIIGLSSYIEEFQDLIEIDTTIASLLVDLTTIYIFFVVLASTNRIKKLKRQTEGEP